MQSDRERSDGVADPEPRELPHDDELERAVLYCLMVRFREGTPANPGEELEPDCFATVTERLISEHFYSAKHRVIFEGILALREAGKSYTMPCVVRALRERGALEDAGGVSYVAGILDGSPVTRHAGEYAARVAELAATRLAIGDISGLLNEVNIGTPAADVIAGAERVRLALEAAVGGEPPKTTRDVGRTLAERITSIYERGSVPFQSTGFAALDGVLGGLPPGCVTILAARPSVGKTTLAMDIAGNIAKVGRRVYVVSLETEADTLQARLAARESGTSLHRVITGQANDYDMGRWVDAHSAVLDWPIQYHDRGRQTVAGIEATARTLAAEDGGIALVVVDYLQLIDPGQGDKDETREAKVARISRGLKSIAMTTRIPLLVLSQLNRRAEQREGGPQLGDLRESGALEQDADLVLIISREDGKDGKTELTIAKNRNGPRGMVSLRFEEDVPRFRDEERSDWGSS